MKVLITGAGGQLGRELLHTAPEADLHAWGSAELDITQRGEVCRRVDSLGPTLIINAAAYTSVDRAEFEPKRAYAVNGDGARHLAESARSVGARLIHVSTDFVFDGTKSSPYKPTDPVRPLGVYGASKRVGEEAVLESAAEALIVRTAWLYSDAGRNFVRTILRLLLERGEIGVVADQIGTPTWARGLAEAIWQFAARPRLTGIYHWTDAGVASWYDFAVAIEEEARMIGLLRRPTCIRAITTDDYPTPAKRPSCSVLDNTATWLELGRSGRHWREGLRRMLRELERPQS